MKATFFSLARKAGLFAGATLALASARSAEADAFPTYDNNFMNLAVGGASISGDKSAYQARTQSSKDGVYGIEEFRYGYDLSKDTNLQIDGQVMPTNGDYLGEFKLAKNEFGTFEAGYKRTRTFYDGHGGFFPTNNAWIQLYDDDMHVDRGRFFATATITMPNAPVFTFKYTNETRTGRKDSTEWGDSDFTGIPIYNVSSLNPITAARKILPEYIDLNERQENWEANMKHTAGNTTAVVTIGGDRIKNQDSRTVNRYLGEMRPWPPIPSSPTQIIPNDKNNNQNTGFDVQGFREKAWTAGGNIETVVSDKVTIFGGINYRDANQDIDASRLITVSMNTAAGVKTGVGGFYIAESSPYKISAARPPYSYTSTGSLKQEIWTGNIGMRTTPLPDLSLNLALKGENIKESGNNAANYTTTAIQLSTGASTILSTPTPESFSNTEKPWTPAIDVRYTGIRTVALYASWEYRSTTQDEKSSYSAYTFNTNSSTIPGYATAVLTNFADNIKEKHHNWSVGANWTPITWFSGRAEFFTKDHENNFQGYGPSAGDFYILNYNIYGVKLTGVLKVAPTLTFTTRYVGQRGKADTSEPTFQGQSNDSHRHQISETVDWNPNKTVYFQANGSVVYNQIITAYPFVSGTAKDVIRNSDNNYFNGDATLGFAVTKEADIQLQGTYYKADNWDPAQAYATLPLGAGAKEYTVSAGVKYRLAPKTVASAKIGYIDSKNETTGGNTNFHGPLAFVSLEHAF